MNTFKTLLMAITLAAAPAAALAQAAPAPTITAPADPAQATSVQAPGIQAAPGAATPAAPAYEYALPESEIGQPIPRGFAIQPQVTEVGEDAQWMHDILLMPVIVIISLFVLALLGWVAFRYRRAANPVPSKTSHNTLIEVIWTLAPVLILLVIAVPSIKLLAKQYSTPKPDLTIKVIGNQWYWTYQYPDNGDFEIVANMLKEKGEVPAGTRFRTDADGPRLLAVDERIVVPVGAVVKLLVTSNDVIHSFAVPAFWTKMDAVPGKTNETWFKADRPGVYFGQCSELCGARHAFMPIAVEVVAPDKFAAWIAAKGGTLGGTGGSAPAQAAATPSPQPAASQPATIALADTASARPVAGAPATQN